MSPKPSPQILRLVIMSLYYIYFHPAKSMHPMAGCLCPSTQMPSPVPNLRRIGRGPGALFEYCVLRPTW
ncbi:hypothetical protein V1524DRAFT_364873 [Lipomyces starkeyi]